MRSGQFPVESLSLTALEALLFERPLLVNGHCPVLVGPLPALQRRLWYARFRGSFSEALATAVGRPRTAEAMGAQGRRYVEENYRWETVEQAYREVLEAIIAGGRGRA